MPWFSQSPGWGQGRRDDKRDPSSDTAGSTGAGPWAAAVLTLVSSWAAGDEAGLTCAGTCGCEGPSGDATLLLGVSRVPTLPSTPSQSLHPWPSASPPALIWCFLASAYQTVLGALGPGVGAGEGRVLVEPSP